MKVDLSNVPDTEPVSPGEYWVEIEEAEESVSGKGTDMIALRMVVLEGEHMRRRIPDALYLAERALWKVKALYLRYHSRAVTVTRSCPRLRRWPPGDIKAVRFGCCMGCRDAGDAAKYRLSFDDRATWIDAETMFGPFQGFRRFIKYESVPAGKRQVWVRFAMRQNIDTTMISSPRIDVDYWDTPGHPSILPPRLSLIANALSSNGLGAGDVKAGMACSSRPCRCGQRRQRGP